MGEQSSLIDITERALLLVEGRDDREFLRLLTEHIGVDGIQIEMYHGKDNLRNRLGTIHLPPGFDEVERIGIVRDADEDAGSAFESICAALAGANLPVPSRPADLSGGSPRIAALIVPPDSRTGCMETMLWQTTGNGGIADCVEEYLSCAEIPAIGNRSDKARVHAYISAQKKPGLKIGEATQAGYWELDHPALNPVKDFLRSLVTGKQPR